MRILRVTNCRQCPLREWDPPGFTNDYMGEYICRLNHYSLDDNHIKGDFPEWCPLGVTSEGEKE